ncbi:MULTISPECIES: site-specific integrase [unclassified Mycolicibacterium]|uniref:tyrosine-type recombinase/integrase n=1 Tax=unclassified Mycolicibacterium TaxID=2636767 RepID=UPI0012DC57D2|nr:MULTISPECIES: site-specific integrase [unclassified Mycolicibacterium]MUL85232.1 site-specific integrase [Mycolicibacterium sp. CBMA 329]MUL91199.1 site-specific integrase [Mycolicibacterium sp. CBMA 331]MUL98132.1 site-specific integrase [Mycolicibacterium sp. CBMA 334]MUM25768.1 site-specific integrase [Mycolicibacterium sp. CBMA 295]MUM40958.1 site-specific integrase [Mycolicibacterium sp. CBMA 247]
MSVPVEATDKPTKPVKRTPGTGGAIDLWKNSDGTPTKLATGRWAQGQGKPQGVGKRWRGWYVGGDGKPRTKRFRTESEAEQWSNTERGKVVTNVWVSPDVGTDTFRSVAELWFTTKQGAQRKPKTLAGYRSILDTLVLPRWGDTPIREITYGDLSAWIASLSVDGSHAGTGLSASRIRQTHQLIGAAFKYAVKAGLASKNIAAEISPRHDLPEAPETEQHYLTHAQLIQFASGAGRFETLTLILGYCGLRFGEAAALRRRDVGDKKITVRNSATYVQGQGIVETATKTKRTRRVPVPTPVWERLKTELPTEPDAFVFPSRKGGHLPLGEYRWAFDNGVSDVQAATKVKRQQETAEAGEPSTPEFPTITPHDLRHTCASLAISEGANVKVVQHMLGHATASMTLDLYGHLMSDDLSEVADKLGKAITAARAVAA